ncbi:MAG: tetratricopeptide repeat protein [Acidobacteriota bacterium]
MNPRAIYTQTPRPARPIRRVLLRAAAAAMLLMTLPGAGCIPSASDRKISEGNNYFEKGDLRRARTRYHAALAINPQNPKAYYALGVIAYTQGVYSSARINFERAIGLDSRDPDFWFHLGNTFSQLKRHRKAVDAYEHVIALERLYPEVYYAKGIAHYNLREWQRALYELERYLRYSPSGERHKTAYQLIHTLNKGGIRSPADVEPATTP